MVERFNGRITELIQQTFFASSKELEKTLELYMNTYNHHIPQKALGHISPIAATKQWQAKRPDLFVKRVYKQAGLDSYPLGITIISICKNELFGLGVI